MSLISIIVLALVFILTLCLITLLMWLFAKQRRSAMNSFAKDLNQTVNKVQLQRIDPKELPVAVDEIKDDVYFCNKAVVGAYDNSARVLNDKNFNVSSLLQTKQETFYHYNIINVGRSKFAPLNQIDLLLTKNHLYLHHPLEPQTIALKQMKDITIFWEKNALMKNKEFFPGVAFYAKKQSYFLLFQNYQQVLKLLACINLTQVT